MPLTAKQRGALPNSAFAYPATRSYPVPTPAQARKAGISKAQAQATARAALSLAARKDTAGSARTVAAKVHKRYPSIGK